MSAYFRRKLITFSCEHVLVFALNTVYILFFVFFLVFLDIMYTIWILIFS